MDSPSRDGVLNGMCGWVSSAQMREQKDRRKQYGDGNNDHKQHRKSHINNHGFRLSKASLSWGIGAGFAKQNRCSKTSKASKPA